VPEGVGDAFLSIGPAQYSSLVEGLLKPLLETSDRSTIRMTENRFLEVQHFGLFAPKVLESFDISFNRLITYNLPLSCLAAYCEDQSLLTT
jgi:hypothetical protein